jgi:tungstate transport system permease protein
MSEVFPVTLLSLEVSALATLISLVIGLPFGTALALGRFPGRAFVLSMINTGMALPPVVVGLFVAMTLWRSGPLGDLKLIYTRRPISSPRPSLLPRCSDRLHHRRRACSLACASTAWASRSNDLALWREAPCFLAALMAGFGLGHFRV